MKFLLTAMFCVTLTVCFGQTEIKLEEIKNHVGDSIKTRGKVFGIRYLENAKNTPTFINLGAAYPNQLLTIVIWGDVRSKLGYKPEEEFAKGFATVYGVIESYKGKLQIVIKNPDQLPIFRDEEVPADQIPPIEKKKDD